MFGEIRSTNLGKIIDISETGENRIKSPDGLSIYNNFLISAILATFRLKAKALAV